MTARPSRPLRPVLAGKMPRLAAVEILRREVEGSAEFSRLLHAEADRLAGDVSEHDLAAIVDRCAVQAYGAERAAIYPGPPP